MDDFISYYFNGSYFFASLSPFRVELIGRDGNWKGAADKSNYSLFLKSGGDDEWMDEWTMQSDIVVKFYSLLVVDNLAQ